jgi:hypothetical protein
MRQDLRSYIIVGMLVVAILLAGCNGPQPPTGTTLTPIATPLPTTLPPTTIPITAPPTLPPQTPVPLSVQFTYVSPCHDTGGVEGRVAGIHPENYTNYKIVVYINVNGVWWGPKPTWANPLTYIQTDGTWATKIVTGGNDEDASRVTAFLIPSSYQKPPNLEGDSQLPGELFRYPNATVKRC